jgi:glutamyl-tRNA synthetase
MNSNPLAPNTSVRVRFAPSPTGFLHIGGVRTALFNYLFAKKLGGKFLLRIEDTDVERSEDRFTQDILSSLKWLGLDHEEPILYQSQRLSIYQTLADDLIRKGLAYRCYCTEAEVEATREALQKAGKKPMYGRTCRDRTTAPEGRTSFAIRAKFPLQGMTQFQDLIRGEIKFPNEDLDDFVMIRTNGVPTYNFVVVVDDIEMQISHVIRGDDHINNTPKQVYLYQALNQTVPLFAHLPMILGEDKKKLSKRNGEASANTYREEGYLPDALLNFLVRLGWSHGDQELFSREEMIQLFDLPHVQVSGAVFNVEKLLWIAGEHLKKAPVQQVLQILKTDFHQQLDEVTLKQFDTDYALNLLPFLQQKAKLIKELPSQLIPLLDPSVRPVDSSTLKWNKDEAQKVKIKAAIRDFQVKLRGQATAKEPLLDHAQVDSLFRSVSEAHGLKLGDLTGPLRLFVTGSAQSNVGLFDLIPIMPSATLHARIDACLNS